MEPLSIFFVTIVAFRILQQVQAVLLSELLKEYGLSDLLDGGNYYQMEQLAHSANTSLGCELACQLLPILLYPSNVSSVGESTYQPLVYWTTQQNDLIPACRVDATSTALVASVIAVSRLTQCPFVVRGGGHSTFAGASSIEGGILVNLKQINSVILNGNKTSVLVGSGNTWSDVYSHLDQQGISVIGGRDAAIGVGGLSLGGGISFFSGRYGWACDNVLSYEVVLANSSVVKASPISHPDLYHALRGGSGTNFGIVTHFELASFPQGQLWSGTRYHVLSTNQSLFKTLYNFTNDAPTDPYGSLYISFGYTNGTYLGVSSPVYGKPVENPPILEALADIPNLGYVSVIQNLTQQTLDVDTFQPVGLRGTFRTATFKNNLEVLSQTLDIFLQEVEGILDVADLLASYTVQPITANVLKHMAKNGGNVLGLSPDDGPLIILSIDYAWSSATDDAKVYNSTHRFISRSEEVAKSHGVDHPFIYMNYADKDQDVFGGYGASNKAFLEEVKRLYDPSDVFGRLQPGYFKI